MLNAKLLMLLIMLFLPCFPLPAQESEYLPKMNEFIDLSGTCNPDYPCFGLFWLDAKMHGTFGNYIPLYRSRSADVERILAITPCLELYDSYTYEICWQFWRGVLGIENFWKFSKRKDFALSLGLIHESDHFTDMKFPSVYARPGYKNIDETFSSGEYLSLRGYYFNILKDSPVNLTCVLGAKYYVREQETRRNYGVNTEVIGKRKLNENAALFASGYFEVIANSFDSEPFGLYTKFYKQPLVYQTVNLGIEFKKEKRTTFQAFLVFTDSNGRGVDMVDRTRSFGWGVRFVSQN